MKAGRRIKNETVKAFEAFKVYRDLGEERSLVKVAEKLGKSEQLISRWSSKYNWVKRIQEYEDELDEIQRKENIKEIKKMAERHAKTSMMFQQKIIERLRSLKPEELSPNDMSRWFEVAAKIERLARGETTEIVKNDSSVEIKNPYQDLTTEELKRLANLSDE